MINSLKSSDLTDDSRRALASSMIVSQIASVSLPDSTLVNDNTIAENYKKDELSMHLLKINNPAVLQKFLPIDIVADGNCLFRAVSLAHFGTEAYYELLRLQCLCEVILNPDYYNRDSPEVYSLFKNSCYLYLPSLSEVIDELQRTGTEKRGHTGLFGILAASTVIRRPIKMFYPLTSSESDGDDIFREYNELIAGRNTNKENQEPINILWTTTTHNFEHDGDVNINHFAALVRIEQNKEKDLKVTDGESLVCCLAKHI